MNIAVAAYALEAERTIIQPSAQPLGRGFAKHRFFGTARGVSFGGINVGDPVFLTPEPEGIAIDHAILPAALAAKISSTVLHWIKKS